MDSTAVYEIVLCATRDDSDSPAEVLRTSDYKMMDLMITTFLI
jgi:hypothetical protein